VKSLSTLSAAIATLTIAATAPAVAAVASPDEVIVVPDPAIAFYNVTTDAFVQSIDAGFVGDFMEDGPFNGASYLFDQVSATASNGALATSDVGGFARYGSGDTILAFNGEYFGEVLTLPGATHDAGLFVDVLVQMPFLIDLVDGSSADTVQLGLDVIATLESLGFGSNIEWVVRLYGPSPNPLDPSPDLGGTLFELSILAEDSDAVGAIAELNDNLSIDIPAAELGLYTFELTLSADISERQGGEPVELAADWDVLLLVPEPGSLALVAGGAMLCLARRRHA